MMAWYLKAVRAIYSEMPYMLQESPNCQITTELPSRPWERVASDLYEFKGAS